MKSDFKMQTVQKCQKVCIQCKNIERKCFLFAVGPPIPRNRGNQAERRKLNRRKVECKNLKRHACKLEN